MLASDPACDALGIPPHLHKHEQQPQQNFTAFERVYVRFRPDTELVKEKPPPGIFNPDEQSLVRESMSRSPVDVLYNIHSPDHFFTWGIAELRVGQIEAMAKTINDPVPRKFTFKVAHVPEACWYPHSEIHIFENDVRVRKVKPGSVRLWLKDTLAEGCRLRKYPGSDGRSEESILP